MNTANQTGWCPSCGCGWDSDPLPFQVIPPEEECRNHECQCHESFYWNIDKTGTISSIDQLTDLEKRYLWGDR